MVYGKKPTIPGNSQRAFLKRLAFSNFRGAMQIF
jgi:hypothetical protein